MTRITASNAATFRISTLLTVYDEISAIEDTEKFLEVLGVQTAISIALESQGFVFDEEQNEWYCNPVEVDV